MNPKATTVVILAYLLALKTCSGCASSACGNISKISYPFRLKTDPEKCGDSRYSLSCENDVTVLYLNEARFYVQAINYGNFTIRLVDAGLDKHDYSSIPQFFFPSDEIDRIRNSYSNLNYKSNFNYESEELSISIYFIKCLSPVFSPIKKLYMGNSNARCISGEGLNDSYGFTRYFSCLNIRMFEISDLMDSCSLETISMFPATEGHNIKKHFSFIDIHRALAVGFEISWFNIQCETNCPENRGCYLDTATNRIHCFSPPSPPSTGLFIWKVIWEVISKVFQVVLAVLEWILRKLLPARCIFGAPFVIAFLIYNWRRRHLSGYSTIEEFLQSHNNLMPIRYDYWDIRKMTKGFKEKLGEGGFGSVYKGKLRSGQFAAIKMLSKPKSNGQDFINEVATIGRIHHANVVNLIGFCVEGSKRALVYDFMSNGSLDKYIFPKQGCVLLSWEKLYQISCGVARGIEYLHRGCEMQILHFDIKPHNILLDENFNPKISDFGLAKLYPPKGTIASLTAARGTIGYMAPELFYKNIGRVSYKADVYSFGMLVLEMTGRRKSLNPMAENLSEIYYPFWVHDRLYKEELEIEDVTEEENKIVRKMILTGLWCIQMKPSDRPPINKALEMLEGDLESLQLPPRPILYPTESVAKESVAKDEGESSSLLVDSEESCSY